jgi:hypothetical protein
MTSPMTAPRLRRNRRQVVEAELCGTSVTLEASGASGVIAAAEPPPGSAIIGP